MKIKILAVTTALLFMFQNIIAFAGYDFGTETNMIKLFGEAEPGMLLSVMLLDSEKLGGTDAQTTINAYNDKVTQNVLMDTDEIYHYETVKADNNGEWNLTVSMPNGEYTKKLTLITSGGDTEFIDYASIDFRTKMIPTIKLAANENVDSLKNSIERYKNYIFGNVVMFDALNNKKAVAILTSDFIKELDQHSPDALTLLKLKMDKANLIASVDEGKVSDFQLASKDFAVDTQTTATITNEGKLQILTNLKGKNYSIEEAYKKELNKQISLQALNYNIDTTADNLHSVLIAQSAVLELNLYELYGLDKADQISVAQKLAKKRINDVTLLQDALDLIIAEIKRPTTGGGIGGGSTSGGGVSSGSSSGSKAPAAGASTSVSEQNIQEQKYVYSDLKQADWACDAIVYLKNKGIVSGYEDGTFKPLKPVTRAEFTKIVVQAFIGRVSKIDGEFSDVSENEWYADYVNTAKSEGIVSGGEDGKFRPDDTITRQDMAVIIYNAAIKYNLIESVHDYLEFVDDDQISDYAKKAVYTLRNNKIISGVGENTFSPLANADRASASQIIYSLMINLSK